MADEVVMKRTVFIGGFILVSLILRGEVETRSLEEPALEAMGSVPAVIKTTNVTTARLSSLSQALEKAVLEQNVKANLTTLSKPSFWQDLRQRFIDEIKRIASAGVGYQGIWRPPGMPKPLMMDCSNTIRYLYQRVISLDLGRTASDQYHYLRLRNRTWQAPRDTRGHIDEETLFRHLQVGDLLFWEHTYRPERYPPITHVMVYLGRNAKGEAIAGGSQSSARGLLSTKRGGPDLYTFEPNTPFGGYRSGLGFTRVQGRFVAFGRPFR